jgi:hypothetical protein
MEWVNGGLVVCLLSASLCSTGLGHAVLLLAICWLLSPEIAKRLRFPASLWHIVLNREVESIT